MVQITLLNPISFVRLSFSLSSGVRITVRGTRLTTGTIIQTGIAITDHVLHTNIVDTFMRTSITKTNTTGLIKETFIFRATIITASGEMILRQNTLIGLLKAETETFITVMS